MTIYYPAAEKKSVWYKILNFSFNLKNVVRRTAWTPEGSSSRDLWAWHARVDEDAFILNQIGAANLTSC